LFSLSNRTALSLFSRSSALALTLACAAPAFAGPREEDEAAKARAAEVADPDPEDDPARAGTNDIVVTAQRREQRLQEVPTAVTALSSELFAEGGVGRSANEVLNLVPNASAGTQQHGRPRWWIRGVGAGQQQLDLANPVGFYLDDVYISNASATGLPLFDIERVEVLRGPQGTLWGKNTTGGAINVISKRPSLTDGADENYVKLEYGSFDNKVAEAGVGAAIVPGVLAARISARIDDREGRFDNLFTGEKSNAVQGQRRARAIPARARAGVRGAAQPPLSRLSDRRHLLDDRQLCRERRVPERLCALDRQGRDQHQCRRIQPHHAVRRLAASRLGSRCPLADVDHRV
jgi:iron complex outermembrane receptor protein